MVSPPTFELFGGIDPLACLPCGHTCPVRYISSAPLVQSFPIWINDRSVGTIIYVPDLSADIREKWIVFLGSAALGVILTLATSLIAFYLAGGILKPLQRLEQKLVAAAGQSYHHALPSPTGPPEVDRAFAAFHELTRNLHRTQHENHALLRRLISVQDEDRADLARELHDELGPQLFAIRAIGTAMSKMPQSRETHITALFTAIEALQRANHVVLERLKPMHIKELGLARSIEGIIREARNQVPDLEITFSIAQDIGLLDEPAALTLYRLTQEAVTNIVRHAKARRAEVSLDNSGDGVVLNVSDDGIGFDVEAAEGRGLRGMAERAQALGGSLEFRRTADKTVVTCRLPRPPLH